MQEQFPSTEIAARKHERVALVEHVGVELPCLIEQWHALFDLPTYLGTRGSWAKKSLTRVVLIDVDGRKRKIGSDSVNKLGLHRAAVVTAEAAIRIALHRRYHQRRSIPRHTKVPKEGPHSETCIDQHTPHSRQYIYPQQREGVGAWAYSYSYQKGRQFRIQPRSFAQLETCARAHIVRPRGAGHLRGGW